MCLTLRNADAKLKLLRIRRISQAHAFHKRKKPSHLSNLFTGMEVNKKWVTSRESLMNLIGIEERYSPNRNDSLNFIIMSHLQRILVNRHNATFQRYVMHC